MTVRVKKSFCFSLSLFAGTIMVFSRVVIVVRAEEKREIQWPHHRLHLLLFTLTDESIMFFFRRTIAAVVSSTITMMT